MKRRSVAAWLGATALVLNIGLAPRTAHAEWHSTGVPEQDDSLVTVLLVTGGVLLAGVAAGLVIANASSKKAKDKSDEPKAETTPTNTRGRGSRIKNRTHPRGPGASGSKRESRRLLPTATDRKAVAMRLPEEPLPRQGARQAPQGPDIGLYLNASQAGRRAAGKAKTVDLSSMGFQVGLKGTF